MNCTLAFAEICRLSTVIGSAFNSDLVISITPATVNKSATSSAWTRTVEIAVTNTAGMIHTWLNGTYNAKLSITDTSTAGTASIVSTNLVLANGHANIVVSGNAAAWLAGETDTLTIATFDVTIAGATVPVTGGTSVQTFI